MPLPMRYLVLSLNFHSSLYLAYCTTASHITALHEVLPTQTIYSQPTRRNWLSQTIPIKGGIVPIPRNIQGFNGRLSRHAVVNVHTKRTLSR
jgi:hypothetical protein